MIRLLNLEDDFKQAAHILYQTDSFIFPFLFGKPEKANIGLSKLMSFPNNSFSYLYTHVYVDSGLIKGLLIETNPLDQLDEEKDFRVSFKPSSLFRMVLGQLFLYPILKHHLEGRYIQNVCVDAPYRGQGIGKELLEDSIKRARQDQIKALYLDVSIENPGAKKLYESYGFEVVKKRRIWGIIPVTYGMIKHID
jgi:ribosomal protein S18 acetylase RimI-like enzyme